jgi:hypothetical protein
MGGNRNGVTGSLFSLNRGLRFWPVWPWTSQADDPPTRAALIPLLPVLHKPYPTISAPTAASSAVSPFYSPAQSPSIPTPDD